MLITELTEPEHWYAFLAPTRGKPGRHIAVHETGPEAIREQMAPYLAKTDSPAIDLDHPGIVLGVPIRVVTDIEPGYIEVRHLGHPMSEAVTGWPSRIVEA